MCTGNVVGNDVTEESEVKDVQFYCKSIDTYRGGSFFYLHTLLECFVPGYETFWTVIFQGMKHFPKAKGRVRNILFFFCRGVRNISSLNKENIPTGYAG